MKRKMVSLLIFALLTASLCAGEQSIDPRDEPSIFGICSSAETSKDYPKWNPSMAKAGMRWLRLWPGWHSIEPKQGEFHWEQADTLVGQANEHGQKVLGCFVFLPKWASTKNDHWMVPPKKMEYWSNYVSETVKRYRKDVKYWEIWNEFNAGFAKVKKGENKAKVYADMVKAASIAAKQVDPEAKIGMSCANFDTNFFNEAIKAGAGGHFDFLCVHPYENLGEVAKGGGEPGFLSMTATLRNMLKRNGLDPNMPLWITEIGFSTSNKPDQAKDALQADALVKCFVLSAAAGFNVVIWFEVRGPNYGKGTDLGIVRRDWSERPAMPALRQLSSNIGIQPSYQGWLEMGTDKKGYGFLFKNGDKYVLCAWAPTDKGMSLTFNSDVEITPVNGQAKSVKANSPVSIDRGLHYIAGLSTELIEQAKANKTKQFPWGGDFTGSQTVRHILGSGVEEGIRPTDEKSITIVNDLTSTYAKTITNKGKIPGHIPFKVHHSFASDMPRKLKITLVAKRLDQKKTPKPYIWFYESLKGYRPPKDKTWEIPPGDEWQTHSWIVEDANFAGQWGYNFTFGTGKRVPFLIKEVRVERLD